jgi:hypothetical protein
MYLLGPNYVGGLEVNPADFEMYEVINERNISTTMFFWVDWSGLQPEVVSMIIGKRVRIS